MNRAIFLDKDGTLIPDIPYNIDPDMITLQPDGIEGLKLLHNEGYLLIIVSNQSGVARGYFTEEKLQAVEMKIKELLAANDIPLSGFYYCPHYPQGTIKSFNIKCDCRKPMPGMLLKAATEHNIDLAKSWMIGDILNDVEAGNRAGCKTVLIDNGNETEWVPGEYRIPAVICESINEAADSILTTQLT
jgi:D-glycero-D-manno-heptose 1,7-bisphosphate phosphatase